MYEEVLQYGRVVVCSDSHRHVYRTFPIRICQHIEDNQFIFVKASVAVYDIVEADLHIFRQAVGIFSRNKHA